MKTVFSLFILLVLISFGSSSASEQQDRAKSFNVKPDGTLQLKINTGQIKISTWNKNEVRVSVKGLIDDEDYDQLKISQANNTVAISFLDNWGSSDETEFQISVPVQFNLNIKTSSGDISVNGNVKGTVKINTRGGDINTNDVDGLVNIETSGGDVSTGTINGNAKIFSSGGDIKTGVISGQAEIKTQGGDITTLDIKKSFTAETRGGDIKTGNIGGNVELITFGGDIKANNINGDATLSTYGGDIRILSARGKVKAKTMGGDLELHGIIGSVEADTKSGDILVELTPSGSGNSSVKSSIGEVTLLIPPNAKADITATVKLLGYGQEDDENEIQSDFPSESYHKDKNSLSIQGKYILNGGGQNITLESVNSGIKIQKLIK